MFNKFILIGFFLIVAQGNYADTGKPRWSFELIEANGAFGTGYGYDNWKFLRASSIHLGTAKIFLGDHIGIGTSVWENTMGLFFFDKQGSFMYGDTTYDWAVSRENIWGFFPISLSLVPGVYPFLGGHWYPEIYAKASMWCLHSDDFEVHYNYMHRYFYSRRPFSYLDAGISVNLNPMKFLSVKLKAGVRYLKYPEPSLPDPYKRRIPEDVFDDITSFYASIGIGLGYMSVKWPQREGPEIVIFSPSVGSRGVAVIPEDKINVSGRAKDNDGIGYVKINGKKARLSPISGGAGFSKEISLARDENRIFVEAMDKKGNKSTRTFTIRREKQVEHPAPQTIVRQDVLPVEGYKPDLWVLSIGVSKYQNTNQNLKYADNDAVGIANAFYKQSGKLFKRVHYRILTNEEATRVSILNKISSFLGQASYNDVVLIFVAGHGVKDKQTGTYYFLTYDAKPDNLLTHGLRMSDFDESLRKLSSNVNKLILFLDTCHAGAMQVAMRGATAGEDLAEALKRAEGTFVLSASKAGEESEESSRFKLSGETKGHGAFTYAILKALTGEGDLDRDGNITISELFHYVAIQVPRITRGAQHPYQDIRGTDMPIYIR